MKHNNPTAERIKRNKAHFLLYWAVAAIFLLGAVITQNNYLFAILAFFLFGFVNFIFVCFNRKLNYSLTRIHCLGTAIFVALFSSGLMFLSIPETNDLPLNFWRMLNIIGAVLQFVFLANIMIGILNKNLD